MNAKKIITCFILFPLLSFSIVKTSISNGNWSNASTWSPSGAPAASDKVRIYHTVNLDQNFSAGDTIFVYKILNIKSGKILTLNPGTMVLVNNATYDGRLGTVSGNAGINGNFIFQKWVTRCDGSSTYGLPFTVPATDPDWYYCNQCMPSWSNLYCYNEAIPGIQDNGYYDNTGGVLTRGKGFFYWYNNYPGGKNFPRQISLKGSVNLTSDFDFNVTRTSSGSFFDDGFNLVANPFPGTIDWLDGAWTKSNVSGVIYTWNGCTGSYGAYASGISVNGGSRYISSMQGFWVQATGSNPQLKAGSGVMVEDQKSLMRTTGDTVDYLLKLDLDGDEIAIHLDPSSTCGMDSANDALKFYTPASRIASSNDPWGTYEYAINSVSNSCKVIRLKTKGSGTLQLNGLSSFYGRYSLYLKDLVNANYLPVTENMQYSFSDTTTVSFQYRFELHLVDNVNTSLKTETQGDVKLRCDEEHIYLNLPDGMWSETQVEMYDLLGRLLYAEKFSQQDLVLPKQNTPVLLRVGNGNFNFTKKIL